ncbi:MAG: 4-(cytidine 5'-diphospho)-2-C-methyl-D-erythritol kinase [Firmicutes bacterium]|nr:4-(cytidine 5'-diphospho)-2-C-methyl-D-erythritol kinase [Bacillota bacterium]
MQLTMKAYAKINLELDVLNRREDGYHDLFSIMQAVDLCDEVTVTRDEEPGIRLTVEGLPEGETLPADSSNLAYRAAEKMLAIYMEGQSARHPAARMLELWEEQRPDGAHRKFGMAAGVRPGVTIRLVKRIPMAAGLAGGSADAAAVILALNKLLYLTLPMSRLYEIGKSLGADVPFCILAQSGESGCAAARGIGEKLTPLPSLKAWLVLVRPGVQVSTPAIFKGWDRLNPEKETGDATALAADASLRMGIWGELLQSGDFAAMAEQMRNDLEAVTLEQCPEVGTVKALLQETAAVKVLMSGSGPTVFAVYEDEGAARSAYDSLKDRVPGVFVAQTI